MHVPGSTDTELSCRHHGFASLQFATQPSIAYLNFQPLR
jgi:hypothetical protein